MKSRRYKSGKNQAVSRPTEEPIDEQEHRRLMKQLHIVPDQEGQYKCVYSSCPCSATPVVTYSVENTLKHIWRSNYVLICNYCSRSFKEPAGVQEHKACSCHHLQEGVHGKKSKAEIPGARTRTRTRKKGPRQYLGLG